MKKLKVMTVVGTRPEIIRLSRVIPALEKYFNHTLVHTGQNYDFELNQIFFDELGLKNPDIYLNATKDSALSTIGDMISKIEPVLDKVKPEAFLVLGDTNSCLTAIAAKKKKIPIFHMEAGNRCFDFRVPEETNRRIVDHIADVNLTYSDIAREYLLKEGLSPDVVIKTGSPMREVIEYNSNSISESSILENLKLKKNNYFLVSLHREENVDNKENIEKIADILNSIGSIHRKPVLVSLHPRTKNAFKRYKIKLNKFTYLHKPFSFKDYVNLQINSKVALSDSGTITEESSILNFPALNLRETHERPEGMEEAAVMMVGLNKTRVLQGIKILDKQLRGSKRSLNLVEDYSNDNISEKVARIILSYVDYINRNIWSK
jgi:UDP-N-acetylglucosamine 2-epimerase (non-hydrolysing)